MAGEAAPLELKDVTSGYGDVAVIRRVSMTFREGRHHHHRRLQRRRQVDRDQGRSLASFARGKAAFSYTAPTSPRETADRRVHRGIAYVPQGRIVVPEMSVRDNLMIGAHILGNNRAAIDAAVERVLQLFPALKPRLKQHADTMSGGEQQMLAIGRALMTSPEIIMLDEPSLGLSPNSSTSCSRNCCRCATKA